MAAPVVQSDAIADSTSSDPVAHPVDDLLADCLALPDADRAAAVEAACETHPELAEELRRRIALLGAAGVLDEPVDELAGVPDQLGEFRIVRKLSSGGMGLVFVAVQESMGREVALKLVRPEQLMFGNVRQRFEREAQLIARLKHPGIVPVYAFGEDQGIPYLAMEYVEGCTLADALRALPQIPPERLRGQDLLEVLSAWGTPTAALRALCEGPWHHVGLRIAARIAIALQHAHECGVVHRDVKPSNVMLAPDGRVMLLDFGLARADDAGELTRSGAQPGSLPYMAPEQVRGEPAAPPTDVYGLGVSLYEMLALNLPYWHPSAEGLRQKVLEARPESLRQRNRALSSDVETVCLTAMDPSAPRRYASAAAFAEDLGNLLENRAIAARPAGPLLRLRRLTRRRPATTVGVVAAALIAVAAPVAINLGIAAERDRAVRRGYAANVIAAGYALGSHNSAAAQQHLARCPEELRGFEWYHLRLRCDRSESHFPGLNGAQVRFLGDGDRFVSGLSSGAIVIARTADGEVSWQRAGGVMNLETSPDRSRFVFASGGRVHVVDAEGAAVVELSHPDGFPLDQAHFSGDGRTVVGSARGVCVAFDLDSGRPRFDPVRIADAYCAGPSHDGQLALFVFWRTGEPGYDPRTELRDLSRDGALVRVIDPDDYANCVAHSPDGRRIALGTSRGGRIKMFELDSGRLLWTVSAHEERTIVSLRFDATGTLLVSAGTDSAIQLHDARDGSLRTTLLGHQARVFGADVSPDASRVISIAPYGGVRTWDPSHSPHLTDVGRHDSPVVALAWTVDGARMRTVADRGAVGQWDARGSDRVDARHGEARFSDGAFDPAGRRAALVLNRSSDALVLQDLASGAATVIATAGYRHLDGDVAFSSDGTSVALASAGERIGVWGVSNGEPIRWLDDSGRRSSAVAFSRDGRRLWTGSLDGDLRVHDLATGDLRTFVASGPVRALMVDDSGGSLWVGEGHDIVERDPRVGSVRQVMSGHQGWVHSLHLAPDGSRLVSASHDGTVRVWDPEAGECLLVLQQNGQWMYDARFSPDGRRIAAAGESGVVTIWESRAP